MLPISQEQQNIVDTIQNNNIIVHAVAGSGKTTTILHIANAYPNYKILVITYNKNLKFETRSKLKLYNINNVTVHTFHSYFTNMCNKECYNDIYLIDVIDQYYIYTNYDIIIFDEAQDIRDIYFKAICKICIYNKKDFRLCILGDQHQCIYTFNNASSNYMLYMDKILCDINDKPWKRLFLSTSYRITDKMEYFVNNILLNQNLVKSVKQNSNKVEFYLYNSIQTNVCIKKILQLLSELLTTYNYYDIAILANSIKYNNLVLGLSNEIKKKYGNKLMLLCSLNEDDIIDEDILRNKLLIMTYHQSKGLERKVIILLGIDSNIYQNVEKCPNIIYVASTRASERLYIFYKYSKDNKNGNKFILDNLQNDKNAIEYINIYDKYNILEQLNSENQENINLNNNNNLSVTNLIKYKPLDILNELYNKITKITHQSAIRKIHIKNKLSINEGLQFEDVSNINGIALVALYEYKIKGTNYLKQYILNKIDENNIICKYINNYIKNKTQFQDIYEIFNNICDNILLIATIYDAIMSKCIVKLYQLNSFDWISNYSKKSAINRINNLNIDKEAIFEHEISYNIIDNIYLTGSIDCIDNKNKIVYEFKNKKMLELDDYIQLSIYTILHKIKLTHLYLNKNQKNIKNKKVIFKYLDNFYIGIVKDILSNIIIIEYENTFFYIYDIYNILFIYDIDIYDYKYYLFNIKTNQLDELIIYDIYDYIKCILKLIKWHYKDIHNIEDNIDEFCKICREIYLSNRINNEVNIKNIELADEFIKDVDNSLSE